LSRSAVEAFENPRVTCYRLSRGGTWLRHMNRATAQVPEPRRVKSRIELTTDLARPPIWALAIGTVAACSTHAFGRRLLISHILTAGCSAFASMTKKDGLLSGQISLYLSKSSAVFFFLIDFIFGRGIRCNVRGQC
jgi:hypothetical protein